MVPQFQHSYRYLTLAAIGGHRPSCGMGLRLLKEHDEVRLRWREQIEPGWQEAQAGRVVDGPAAMARIKRRSTARSKKRA